MRDTVRLAEFYRTAAAAFAQVDARKAAELLNKAAALGDGAVDPRAEYEKANADFKAVSGFALDDPEYRERVYAWVAEQRRQELEKEAKIAQQRAEAARTARGRRGRARGT